jgi:uncharacterized protein (TIGR02453 family)
VPPSAPPAFRGFPAAALTFLRGLRRHNEKAWFEANRDRYERDVRLPLRALVEALDDRLATFAPELVGDVKRSVFRIHRDVRFSKDKSPYKTHVAAWFFHRRAGKGVGSSSPDGGAAGLYVHIEPGASMVGGGLWMPPRPALQMIREAIVARQAVWEATLGGAVRRRFGGLDESAMLARMPRGYAPDHPAAAWLRHQSFTLGRPLADDDVTSPRLVATLARDFALLLPMVRFLNDALGHPPDERRVV